MRNNMTAKLFEALHEVNEDRFSKNKKSILEMTTSEVIEEEATEDKSYKMCPRCGRPYSDYPAISRYDDKTEICPDCGVEEAMINYTGGTLEAPNKYKDKARRYNKYKDKARRYNKDNSKRISEEVTIDTPTQEDLDRDEENTKAMNKKEIEDRIGELRLAIEDGAISNDETESVRKQISELENKLLNEDDDIEEPEKESEEQEESEECEDKKEISNAKSFDEVIDLLVADEEEAIEGYNEAIEKLKELDEKEKEKLIDMLSHIRDEEKEHIDELENKEIEEREEEEFK